MCEGMCRESCYDYGRKPQKTKTTVYHDELTNGKIINKKKNVKVEGKEDHA
jgi:hypothetical protein